MVNGVDPGSSQTPLRKNCVMEGQKRMKGEKKWRGGNQAKEVTAELGKSIVPYTAQTHQFEQ